MTEIRKETNNFLDFNTKCTFCLMKYLEDGFTRYLIKTINIIGTEYNTIRIYINEAMFEPREHAFAYQYINNFKISENYFSCDFFFNGTKSEFKFFGIDLEDALSLKNYFLSLNK
jgi:hypothetical protein